MKGKIYGYISIAIIIAVALFLAYGGFSGIPGNPTDPISAPGSNETDQSGAVSYGPSEMPTATPTYSGNSSETVNVASFNIQVFGESKAAKENVMDVLAGTIRNYDIIGIQEIRDKNGTALPALVDLVNNGTDDTGAYAYDYVVSDRLGRSTSKEQYAYIYNTKKVYVTSEPWVYPDDEADYFEREPYVVSFAAVNGDFEAVLVLIHTKPDDATNEIDRLADVMDYAKSIYTDKKNFVVMGDLNADGSYFDESGDSSLKSEDYVWLIGNDVVTTTKTNNTYDRIVVTAEMMPYYTGNSGVYDIKTIYGLNQSELTEVSDHYPIYAEFKAWIGAAAAEMAYAVIAAASSE